MAIDPINKISDENLEKIKQKSAQYLPNNPSARGMSADQIRKAFYAPITESQVSIVAEVNRVVDEANAAFDGVDDRFLTNENEISSIEDMVSQNKSDISSNQTSIEKNIDKIVEIDGILKDHQSAIEGNTGRLDNHDSALSMQGSMISENANNLLDHESRIEQNEKDIYQNEIDINTNRNYCDELNTAIGALSVKVNGYASSYVISTLLAFINDFLATGVSEGVDVNDMVTGSNILITEKEVPDFWFERTEDPDKIANAEKITNPDNPEEKISLVVNVGGIPVGICHTLEPDYEVIEGHAVSAQKAAAEAKNSAVAAENSAVAAENSATNLKGDFEEYVQSLLDTIEDELDGIIAIQKSLIGGDAE